MLKVISRRKLEGVERIRVITHEQHIGFMIEAQQVEERGTRYFLHSVLFADNSIGLYSSFELNQY